MEATQVDRDALFALESSCIPLAVYQFVDERVKTVLVSDGFCEQFGFAYREHAIYVMDNDMYKDAHPDDVARIADAAYQFATEGGEYEVIYRTRTLKSSSDGEDDDYTIVHAIGKHVYASDGERYAVVWYTDEGSYTGTRHGADYELNQMLRRALYTEGMMHKPYFDALTGLPNTSHFFELAEAKRKSLIARGKVAAMLFIDLSGMKLFNQQYGLAEGDRLLRAVSRILIEWFGSECCSRLSQDHFAAVIEKDGLDDAVEGIIEECRTANGGKTLPVRIGIYVDEMGDVDANVACDRAKVACDSKHGAFYSTFCYYDRRMLDEEENRQYVIDNLDKALSEGWVQVYYQPIVRTANGSVCDEEALARWIDPVKGFLSPVSFIPVLEDSKLVYKLDLYVVEQILKKIKRLTDAGIYTVPTSVNLSRSDFEACDMVEEITRRVDEAGVPRRMLTIEITESALGRDFDFMKLQVDRFHELGYEVWMDDFGSEYSSLDFLQSIQFDLIKFDMKFMEQFETNNKSKIILTELAKMAINLNIDMVAEGVETYEQVRFLHKIGCGRLQGFYFSKPNSLEDVLKRYEDGTAIGFENPAESEYYNALGKVNLYDLTTVASDERESFQRYFNTLPMAVMELQGNHFRIARYNESYRDFIERAMGMDFVEDVTGNLDEGPVSDSFLRALRECGKDGKRRIVDNRLPDGTTVNSLMRRVATNPVTGAAAVAVAVLDIGDKASEKEAKLARYIRALTGDYFCIYAVDLETDRYVEYSTANGYEVLGIAQEGTDFFKESHENAPRALCHDDVNIILERFTKDKVLVTIRRHGLYTLRYRLMVSDTPTPVILRAVLVEEPDGLRLIIGISPEN